MWLWQVQTFGFKVPVCPLWSFDVDPFCHCLSIVLVVSHYSFFSQIYDI